MRETWWNDYQYEISSLASPLSKLPLPSPLSLNSGVLSQEQQQRKCVIVGH